MKKITWIGTGVMGRPMALHLSNAGYEVSVYNRTYSKAQAMEPEVKAFDTIKDAVADADIIFTIVGYPKDVKDVYAEIMTHAKTGAVLVDMTTSSPTLAKSLYADGLEKGFKVLDAPVTGGDLGAINGTLSIMVGGDKAVFDELMPLFEILGSTVNFMGSAGNGQNAKLANQTAIAGSLVGTAEALAFAHKKGMDLTTMLNVITGGSAASWQAQNNGPKMISKDYAPGFFMKHFAKDVRFALDEREDLVLPVLTSVESILTTLESNGFENDGTQAIIEYYLQALK